MRVKRISSPRAGLGGRIFLIVLGMLLSAAVAAAQTHTIAASAGAGGTLSPSGDVTVADGADQSFTIAPDAGYHVSDVLVDGDSQGAILEYTFTNVTVDHTIEAQFAANSPVFVTDVDTVNVPEGSTATFQVKLSEQPTGDVNASVTRASGDTDITVQSGASLTFTTGDWNSYQTVTLAAADDVDTTNGTATIRVAAAGIPDKDVTAPEQDNDTLNFETNVSTVNVPEGSTATFQVRLTAQPSADVDATVTRASGDTDITVQSGAGLTFTTANWDSYQTVTLAAAEDVDVENGTAIIRVSASGIPDKDVTAVEQDNDTLQFVTDTDQVNVPEGATAVLQVQLSAKPSGNTSVTAAWISGDTDITVQSGGNLTFNASNWDVYQPVTLAAAQDDDTVNGTATIRISAAGIPNKDVTATEQDNDTLSFLTSVDALAVPEGSTATFQVRLSAQPSADVSATVTRASGDTDITVQSGAGLTFTTANWSSYQTVTLAAAEDADITAGTATIRVAASGLPNKDVTATEQDNDSLTFVTDVPSVAVVEGGTATFQVRLTAQPSADVDATVTRASGDTDITVQSGAGLTFTTANWDSYQTVTLAAAEDVDTTNGTATIRIASSGVPNKDIAAAEQDNDTLQFVTSVSAVNVPEGGTATFQVRLSARPSASVSATVTRASGDSNITVQSGASLTFTTVNWNSFQTVTLAAAEDADALNGTATIRITAAGLPNKDVTAIEQDDDADNGTIALVLNPSLSTSGLLVEATAQILGNDASVAAFGLDLVYNATWFNYEGEGTGTLTSNWTITVDSSTAGRLKIRGVGGTIIPASSTGSLVRITLQVRCLGYIIPTISTPRLENYADDLFDEFLPLPAASNFTYYPCARLGDVNNDGNVTPGDAQSAFEIYLGRLTPTFCQQMTSDGNCSFGTTPGDAQDIFEHYLGKQTLPICCTQATTSSSGLAVLGSLSPLEEPPRALRERGLRPPVTSKFAREPENRRGDARIKLALYALDTIGRPGEAVDVPVVVSSPRGLRSFAFDLLYPFDMLEYRGAKRTSLTQGFDYVLGTEESPGLIHVEAESQEAIVGRELGSLVLLSFRVKEGADFSLPMQVVRPVRDLREAEAGEGIFVRSGSLGSDPRWVSLGSPVPAGESLYRVPVVLNELFGLKAFGFEVSYAPESATFVGIVRPGSDSGLIDLQAREVEPGRVRVGGFRVCEDLRREPGVLVELVFRRNTLGAMISLDAFVDDLAKAEVTRGNLRLE